MTFIKNKYILALILTTLTIFIIMGISGTKQNNFVIKDAVNTAISPVQKFFFNIGKSIKDFSNFIVEVKNLKSQNEELLEKVYQLENENRRLKELEAKNAELKKMLGLKERYEFKLEAAQIIGKDPGNWFNTFTIDKGTSHGLKKDCAVITSKGLVGYIYDINVNSAKVMSIIDNDSAVGSKIVRTKDFGVVKGDLTLQNSGLCRIVHVSKDSDVIIGDLVETSGLGGIYPKGLLIGKIKSITPNPYSIIVEPAVDFKHLEEVFVITKESKKDN